MDSAETKGSSSQLKILQDEMIELETDLVNGGTRYPTNLTIGNFTDFLFLPTLVYELEYARNATVRIWYVLEKAVGTCFACFTMYLTVQHHVLPHIRAIQKQELFLGICNGFAEITRFADRDFYEDWWNSVNFEEFARKWNKPVHEFLLRHIYLEGLRNYKLSKRDATFVTFLMSSLLHECVLFVVGKRPRPYFIFFQMFQIPLLWIMSLPKIRDLKLLGYEKRVSPSNAQERFRVGQSDLGYASDCNDLLL
ncbi:MAG: hypothetical protein SGCHY_004726 [Lobulomycetales sp.]